MAELAIGDEFAGHRIEGVAGRGGMGIVYRALDLRLKRVVAMKVVAPELAQDSEFRERFERESQLAASIDHTNVIPIHHAGEEDGVLFITMRYIQGTDLAALIAREGRLEPTRVVTILSGVARALDAAHSHELIHRDVKPANILLEEHTAHEHVYLTDFGLTKLAGASGPTRTGFAVGTFDYMAPEQFLAQPVDARCDVYALGCVLFEALTGRVPFPRPGDAARMYAHIQENPPVPSEAGAALDPGASKALAAFDPVVSKALAKDPNDRYPSAGALADAASVSAGIDRPATRPRQATPTPVPTAIPRPSTAAPGESTPAPTPAPASTGPDVTVSGVTAPGGAPAPPTPAMPAPGAPGSAPPGAPPAAARRMPAPPSRRPLLIGGAIAGLLALVVLGVLVLGGGGDEADTTTPEGTVSAFLADIADGDGGGACQLLTANAQQQAVDSPASDCPGAMMQLTGRDAPEKAPAIRSASYDVTVNGSQATAVIDLPDPQAAVGSVTRSIPLTLEQSGDQWLISDITPLCMANNVTC